MSWTAGLEHVIREGEPLSRWTWLRLGGPAEFFAEPTSVEELSLLVRRAGEAGITIHLLGGGSNLLVHDSGAKGLTISLSAGVFSEIKVSKNSLVAGAGAKLAHVTSVAAREGLVGFEDLCGIPGTVGGAIHGNAGSTRVDIGQWTKAVTVLNPQGELIERTGAELRFTYRASILEGPVYLSARFELERSDPIDLTKRMQKNWIIKKASLPPSDAATACLFRDPPGATAKSLIEQSGLVRFRVGDAELSGRNANFVITGRNAKSSDVQTLIETVRDRVRERMAVDLELALEIW
jgi:UDP-N-acetylmuramate dehydrogenase